MMTFRCTQTGDLESKKPEKALARHSRGRGNPVLFSFQHLDSRVRGNDELLVS